MKLTSISMLLMAILGSVPAYSQVVEDETLADSKSYCDYIRDKNKAKSILLRSPDAIARLDNGLNYNNFQRIAVTGLSKDLSDLSKAYQVDELINNECTYYTLNQEAKLQARYAIASIRAKALQFKLEQIHIVKKKLMALLDSVKQRVDSKSDTIFNYYGLDSSLIKLEDSERAIYIELANQHIPRVPSAHLKSLLKDLSNAQEKRQITLNKLEKQNNWSIRLEAGTQKDLSSGLNQSVQPYFALLLRYNLGDIASNSKRGKSIADYVQWQKKQVLGTQRQLFQLINSIKSLKNAEQERLSFLMKHFQSRYTLSEKFNKINSIKANHFKQSVEVDRLMMEIEINYLKYSIALLDKM